MKKITTIILLIFLLAVPVYATGETAANASTSATTGTTAITEAPTETETPAETEAPTETPNGTWTDKISKKEIAETARWLAVLIVNMILFAVSFGKFKKSDKKQDDVANVVNELIDGYEQTRKEYAEFLEKMEKKYTQLSESYEAMREAYEKYGETELDRNRVIGAVMEQSAATLEILQFAYANSSKLPQGIKDVINLKYANALKTLGNDKQLLEIVELVRKGINDENTEEREE